MTSKQSNGTAPAVAAKTYTCHACGAEFETMADLQAHAPNCPYAPAKDSGNRALARSVADFIDDLAAYDHLPAVHTLHFGDADPTVYAAIVGDSQRCVRGVAVWASTFCQPVAVRLDREFQAVELATRVTIAGRDAVVRTSTGQSGIALLHPDWLVRGSTVLVPAGDILAAVDTAARVGGAA